MINAQPMNLMKGGQGISGISMTNIKGSADIHISVKGNEVSHQRTSFGLFCDILQILQCLIFLIYRDEFCLIDQTRFKCDHRGL